MQKPILTLKNLSHNARLSEETECFAADLYVDGVKTASVANRGHGGCHEMHFYPTSKWNEKSLNEACKAAYGQYESYGMTMDYNLELLISIEVGVQAELKAIKRTFKSKVVTLEGNEMKEYGWKGCKTLTQAHFDAFNRQHPGKEVLNLKSEADLVAIVRKLTADR